MFWALKQVFNTDLHLKGKLLAQKCKKSGDEREKYNLETGTLCSCHHLVPYLLHPDK